MDPLVGEALLAVTGITAALRPGPLRVTQAILRRADRLAGEVARRLKPLLAGREPAEMDEPEADYDEILKLLTLPTTRARLDEDVAAWPPELQGAYGEALGTAWGYLQTVIPTAGDESGQLPVPDTEMIEFSMIYAVVDDPMLALDRLADGSLIPEEAEAFRQVYPKVYDLARTELLRQMVDVQARKPTWEFPHERQVALETFLGTSMLDAKLQSEIQRVLEDAHHEQQQAGGKRSVTLKDSLTTPNQRISEKGGTTP